MDQISSIATLDWVVVIVIIISTLLSLKRGFVQEVLSLATWGFAFIVAVKFSISIQSFLVDQIQNVQFRYIVAFLGLFILSLCIGSLVSFLIGSLVRATGMSSTDRVLGMIFGFARGALILVILVSLMSLSVDIVDTPFWQESIFAPKLVILKDWLRELLGRGSEFMNDPSFIEQTFSQSLNDSTD
ncbi:CvpA family protein [Marinomonas agarivorans]|nr:CvpA family protein [Marinomonas agarivorans]